VCFEGTCAIDRSRDSFGTEPQGSSQGESPQDWTTASAEARIRFARKNEATDLARAFEKLDCRGDGRLDVDELFAALAKYGHNVKKVACTYFQNRHHCDTFWLFDLQPLVVQDEVGEMIWEVDEDCDNSVSWSEFQKMYHRCSADRTGGGLL
jgi:calmodulin